MSKFRMRLLLSSVVVINVFLSYLIIGVLFTDKPRKGFPPDRASRLNLTHVIVHLDFKGAPPKLGYLTSLLSRLKANGATGLLLEYEDMFPYDGVLANLSARNCYGKDELSSFLRSARSLNLELIPLIQTFGHMESALKLREFQHLREVPEYPDSLCPSVAGSRVLISQMLEQVLNFHSRLHVVKYVHIGCDEVFHINTCARCRSRMLKDEDIFLQHVILTSAEIKGKRPDITVLIWDDMLRGISPLVMKQYTLRTYIEPVVWDYKPRIDVSHLTIYKYFNSFDNIWIASAFKGADRKSSTLPDILNRFRNHDGWMKFISNYRMAGNNNVYSFTGIFMTGWSRFSHFDALCEILPLSLPSLMLSLLAVRKYKVHDLRSSATDDSTCLDNNLLNEFNFESNYTGKINIYVIIKINRCHFNVTELYTTIVELDKLVNVIANEERKLYFENGDLLEMYVSNARMNPNELLNVRNKFELFDNQLKINSEKVKKLMKVYYDKFVISEYIALKVKHVLNIVGTVLSKVERIEKIKSWNPGPIW